MVRQPTQPYRLSHFNRRKREFGSRNVTIPTEECVPMLKDLAPKKLPKLNQNINHDSGPQVIIYITHLTGKYCSMTLVQIIHNLS